MIYVLLPAYNEAENIGPLLDSIGTVFAGKADGGHKPLAVVVDDGGTDGTGEIARSRTGPPETVTLVHKTNLGLGAALETGIQWILDRCADGDTVITLDADGTHHPKYMPAMIEALEAGRDIVIASRYAEGGMECGVSSWRKMLSHGAHWCYRAFFPGWNIEDFSCGYRAIRAGLLRKAADRWGKRLLEAPGFACTGELMLKLLKHTSPDRVAEIPFELHYEEKRGRSKMPAFQTILGTLILLIRSTRW